MYQIKANFYDDFYIYKNGILIMTAKRKFNWLSRVRVNAFSVEDKLLLTYSYSSFFYTFLKIKYQNLPCEVRKGRSKCGGLTLKVNNHEIRCKLNLLPLREMGRIWVNNKEIAKIINEKVFGSSLKFRVEFNEDHELQIYCVLLFLMNISTIDSM